MINPDAQTRIDELNKLIAELTKEADEHEWQMMNINSTIEEELLPELNKLLAAESWYDS